MKSFWIKISITIFILGIVLGCGLWPTESDQIPRVAVGIKIGKKENSSEERPTILAKSQAIDKVKAMIVDVSFLNTENDLFESTGFNAYDSISMDTSTVKLTYWSQRVNIIERYFEIVSNTEMSVAGATMDTSQQNSLVMTLTGAVGLNWILVALEENDSIRYMNDAWDTFIGVAGETVTDTITLWEVYY